MNKTRKLTFIVLLTVLTVLFSCQEPFLSEPQLSSGGAKERGIFAPEGIKASQGEKRNITLSWNEQPKAVLYYVYQTENPLNTFVRCGETTSTQFKFNVPPGSTLYFQVSSVSLDGMESSKSVYVRGTSLAQPVISDITDITESEAAVTWYMENVFDDSYKNDLLYTVYCYSGASEIAQIALDGSVISENRAVFTSLAPNTRYEYQVEAYLRGDQSASEKSDKMDAATARRFRPGAPINLIASHGTAADKTTLSFELPDMVDIALGENLYDPKPVYFVIYRRFYSESGNNEYLKACSYFGSNKSKGASFTGGYIPGAAVTWNDTAVNRGVKYEYMVQSYVDDTNKIITSESSKSNSYGWALSEGNLSFGKVEYTIGNGLYTSAVLPLDFEFDPQAESYDYVLKEEIEPLGDDDPLDPAGKINRETSFNTYNAIRTHVPTMDLTKKTTSANPGRGLYSYAIEIKKNGELLDTVSTIGKKEVSDNTDPIIVDNFRVQDGYKNKFVLKWDNYSNRKYTLFIVDSKGTVVKEIGSVNNTPTADAVLNSSYSYTYEASDIVPGVTRYFAIRPFRDIGGGSFKNGQMVYAAAASKTLGVPELSLESGVSYSAITAAWSDTQKADTYRIKFRYTGDTSYKTAATVKKENLSFDAAGKLKYTFKPEGNEIDITKAGKEIQIQVDALNEGLRLTLGGEEISTSSKEDVRTRLLGPSELGLSAGRASSAQEIDVSWNKITDADGYYVFRRKFNMVNSSEEGTDAVVYYVPAVETATINITGKDMALDSYNSKVDTNTVKATASFANSRYTLKDIYMSDGEYDGGAYSRHTISYRNQQNDMIQGYPYRYWVVPVKSDTALNSIDFAYIKDSSNKNADITYYTIQENGANIKYSGAASVERNNGTGFTIGLGQNVTATKGTFASSGNINDGVKITWSPPPLLSAADPQYTVFRRASDSNTWELITSVTSLQHIDTTLRRGITYEYAIGITNGTFGTSDPRSTRRFIELCRNLRDDKNRPFMLGYTLDMVRMNSVSRNERKVGNAFAEEVNWKSAKITNTYSDDYNWGIDGYEVYVMNRNIDAEWHKITEVSYANIKNQTDQSIMVTTGMGSITLNTTAGAMSFDLLRVMRDYKHFFKIRSYVLNNNNERIYCPDPNWTYTYQFGTSEATHITASNNMQNDYVKWGARQISGDEFIQIASVYASRGINESWAGASDKTYNAGTTWGGSGSVTQDYTYKLATDAERNYKYSNFKVDLQTRTGQWVTFITIHGNIWSRMYPIGSWPFRYGEDGWVTIKGPWDTPDLYTGQIKFGVNGLGNNSGFSWNGNGTLNGGTSTGESGDTKAKIAVKYPGTVANPGAAAEVQYTYRGQDTALQFKEKGDNRYQLEHYK